MISEQHKLHIIHSFEKASEEFDFVFFTPYYLGENNEYCFFGYLCKDNLEKGVIFDIETIENETCSEKWAYCNTHDVFYSRLALEPLLEPYSRSYFREMLRDWRYQF